MNNPLISIIIACYNARPTLRAALDSLLTQSFRDFEIIVVDGASQDGTIELLQDYEVHIARWVSEPDAGIYDAWNKGIQMARGRWIGFLGADDVYLPYALQEYARYLADNNNLEFVSAQNEVFDDIGRKRIIGKPWRWVEFRRYMCIAHVGSLHARSLFEIHGSYDPHYKICGDYEFLLRAGERLRTGFLNRVVARMHAGGISGSNINALNEARSAKLQTRAVMPLIALYDYYVALIKWRMRQTFNAL